MLPNEVPANIPVVDPEQASHQRVGSPILRTRTRLLVLVFGISAAIGTVVWAVRRASPAAQPQTPQDIILADHLATAEKRRYLENADTEAVLDYIRNGMERSTAGFHLIRPTDDPTWDSRGNTGRANGYHWMPVPVNYPNIEYQRLLPVELQLAPNYGLAYVSLSRCWGHNMCTASVASEPSGTYQLSVTFSPRAVLALSNLIKPVQTFGSGDTLDWHSHYRTAGEPESRYKALLIAEERGYLPICVQDVLAQGPGPTTVPGATGLDLATATRFANYLNAP